MLAPPAAGERPEPDAAGPAGEPALRMEGAGVSGGPVPRPRPGGLGSLTSARWTAERSLLAALEEVGTCGGLEAGGAPQALPGLRGSCCPVTNV